MNSILKNKNIKTYIQETTKQLYDKIKNILLYLVKNNIKYISKKKHDEYKEIARIIILFYHDIFINKKSNNQIDIINKFKDFKTIKEIFNVKYLFNSGIYNISKENIDTLEILLNNVSNIYQATGRDLNG